MNKLAEALIEEFGTQCKPHMEEIQKRIVREITAVLYFGDSGKYRHAMLNRLHEAWDNDLSDESIIP